MFVTQHGVDLQPPQRYTKDSACPSRWSGALAKEHDAAGDRGMLELVSTLCLFREWLLVVSAVAFGSARLEPPRVQVCNYCCCSLHLLSCFLVDVTGLLPVVCVCVCTGFKCSRQPRSRKKEKKKEGNIELFFSLNLCQPLSWPYWRQSQ